MIAAIVDVKVDPAKVDELTQAFSALRERVLANEPGVITYHLVKPRDGSENYRFIEIYQDMEAVKAHSTTEYMREANPKLIACLTEDPVFNLYEVAV